MLAALAVAATLAAGTGCGDPAVPVPRTEPHVTAGRSAFVAGIYLQGGAVLPGCRFEPHGPYAGTVPVFDAATGARVASQTLRADGRLFRIPLAPGTYTVRARARRGWRLGPLTVTITAGHRTRDDFFLDVP